MNPTAAAKRLLGTSRSLEIEDAMRKAANLQLEHDQRKLESFLEYFSSQGHSADANDDLKDFISNFKKVMRPTTQEES